jgi:ABC-2 type transport system ATP-binding protein
MHALEVDSLTKRYGRVMAVAEMSFAVERGAVYGLLGPNGSGKTTTLACSLGLLRPSGGRVIVLGEDARRLHRTRGRVGVVFDAPIRVRGLSVRGQLAYAMRLLGRAGERGRGRSADELLSLTGLTALARRPVARLSLGQEKRLAVATALAGDPELLVLDEPLSGLDPVGARRLLRLVRELAQSGVAVVLSSHRLHEVEPVLTHAGILIAGRLAAEGPIEALLASRARLRVGVDDPPRALEALSRLGGSDARAGAQDGRLLIELGGRSPAEVNRALVEAGIAVSELRSDGDGLPGLFDALVDELQGSAVPEGER